MYCWEQSVREEEVCCPDEVRVSISRVTGLFCGGCDSMSRRRLWEKAAGNKRTAESADRAGGIGASGVAGKVLL